MAEELGCVWPHLSLTHRSKTGKGNDCRMKVNFLPEIIILLKEVQGLVS